MTNSESEDKKNKGFAGLNFMVSDISATAEVDSKSGPQETPMLSGEKASHLAPVRHPHGSVNSDPQQPLNPKVESEPYIHAWFWILIAFIICASLISSNNKTSTPNTTLSADMSSAPTEMSTDFPAQVPTSPKVTMPPVGRNQVLNVSEIRYCKTEKIRIDAFDSVINSEYQQEVDRFNTVVNDYNSRCGEFRYRRGDLERAQLDIDQVKESITVAAKSEWVRSSLGLDNGKKVGKALKETKQTTDHVEAISPNAALVQKNAVIEHSHRPEFASGELLSDEENDSIVSACSVKKNLYGLAAYNECWLEKLSALKANPRNIDLSGLSKSARISIQNACSTEKELLGPAAYNKCLSSKVYLSDLSNEEKDSLVSACSAKQVLYGPAAYNECWLDKVSTLKANPRNIDLSGLSKSARISIQNACSTDKELLGPAAYNKCLNNKLRELNL